MTWFFFIFKSLTLKVNDNYVYIQIYTKKKQLVQSKNVVIDLYHCAALNQQKIYYFEIKNLKTGFCLFFISFNERIKCLN